GAGALDTVGKLVVGRPRPPHQLVAVFKALESHSFPSGHASFYVCYFGFIFYLAWTLVRSPMALRRLVLMLSAIPVALVGLSRLSWGGHGPCAWIGGYRLGGVWLSLSVRAYRRWKERARRTALDSASLRS